MHKDVQPFLKNPNPSQASASLLHHRFQQRIKKSFILLLQEVSRVLNKDFNEIICFLTALDENKHFSVNIYYVYYSLLEHMVKNDFQSCEALCNNLLLTLLSTESYVTGLTIRSFESHRWEERFEHETLHFLPENRQLHFEKASTEEVQSCQEDIHRALSYIAQSHEGMEAEIKNHVHLIRILKGDFDIFLAGSGVKYFGVISIILPPAGVDSLLYFFDLVVHETSHLQLNIMMSFDPIVLNKSDELYFSPIRNTKRPMKGIFHAHFVFYRLILAYFKAQKLFDTTKINFSEYDKNLLKLSTSQLPWDYKTRLMTYIHKFEMGEEIIRTHARLTTYGQVLLDNISKNFKKIEEFIK